MTDAARHLSPWARQPAAMTDTDRLAALLELMLRDVAPFADTQDRATLASHLVAAGVTLDARPAPECSCRLPKRITAIEAEAVAAERARITEAAATVVSHLAFECKNSRVRQGVQMGAAAVIAIVEATDER